MMEEKIKGKALLSWYWLVNSANNEKFGHFQLKTYFFYPNTTEKTVIKYLQLYLPFLGNN